MGLEETKELKQKALNTDTSLNNPGIQLIIENELANWVNIYEGKKTIGRTNFYGDPGEIPDQIEINGIDYTPNQILEHVKARDEEGMVILEKIHWYAHNRPLGGISFLQEVIDIIPDGADLDGLGSDCRCGQHKKSKRDLLLDVIETNPDSLILSLGWPKAIQELYGAAPLYKKLLKSIFSS